MSKRADRQSNIELLRIFAACGVIILHYNNAKIGGGYAAVEDGSLNQGIMTFFELLFICAVNLYVLISGYFMRSSMKRDLLKPIELLAQLFVFELLFCLIKELPKGNGITFTTLLSYFTPSYWFVFVYIALYLVSPYVNLVWKSLDDRKKKVLLSILLGLFSIYPLITDIIQYHYDEDILGNSPVGLLGSQEGYTIVVFVLMYLIGCFLKDLDDKKTSFKQGVLVGLLALNIFGLFGWTYLEKFISGKKIFATTAIMYENPFVISAAVIIFLIFKNMKMGSNKVINKLATASFPAYLIHINLLEYCGIERFVKENPFLLVGHIIGSTLVIYLISFVIYMVYDLVTRPLFNLIDKKWKNRRKYEV